MKNSLVILIIFISFLSKGQDQPLQQILPASGDYKSQLYQTNWSLGEIFADSFQNSTTQSSTGFNESNSIYIITAIESDELLNEDYTLFPNPFTNNLILEAPIGTELHLSFYDEQGKSLPITISQKNNQLLLNPGEISSGLYILKAIDNKKEVHQFRIIRK